MGSTQLPLRDIHLPEAIGWWPPALGWWLLAVMVPLSIAFGYWLYKRITRKTAIKAAKILLLQIRQDKVHDNCQKLQDISALIRRTAISASGRNECAGLTGQQWLEYLDSPFKKKPFTEEFGRLLIDAPYQKAAPTKEEIVQLINLCENWLNAQSKRKR
jgi:cbb3-type cytochrome oxidase subunit 3